MSPTTYGARLAGILRAAERAEAAGGDPVEILALAVARFRSTEAQRSREGLSAGRAELIGRVVRDQRAEIMRGERGTT